MSVPIVISVNADFICEAVRLALSCFGQVLQILCQSCVLKAFRSHCAGPTGSAVMWARLPLP